MFYFNSVKVYLILNGNIVIVALVLSNFKLW